MTDLHLDAGKYAAFLWPAYAITAAGFAWMIAATLLRARRWRREVERLEAARPRKGGADSAGGGAGDRAA
ncbi:MAG: heme exporter protein CcmD [Proteobacteria bacterium]|nr:heme exporter protein CcmD [Pseudomonadota bacterium]